MVHDMTELFTVVSLLQYKYMTNWIKPYNKMVRRDWRPKADTNKEDDVCKSVSTTIAPSIKLYINIFFDGFWLNASCNISLVGNSDETTKQ